MRGLPAAGLLLNKVDSVACGCPRGLSLLRSRPTSSLANSCTALGFNSAAKLQPAVGNRLSCGSRRTQLDQSLRCPVFASASAAAGATALAGWVQGLIGVGIFIACVSASLFLLAAIPAIQEVRLAARRVQLVMMILERDMPETFATMRLSSLEISDCIEEFSELGSDLTSGLRASAGMAVAAEQGVKDAARAVTKDLIPALQGGAPIARDQLETVLQHRAKMQHTQPVMLEMARATKTRVQALRTLLKAADLGGKAVGAYQLMRSQRQEPGSRGTHQPPGKSTTTGRVDKDSQGASDIGGEQAVSSKAAR